MSYTPSEEDFDQYMEKPSMPIAGSETSALGAAFRAAGRAPFSLAETLGVPKENLVYPEMFHEQPGDVQHPIAQFFGSMAFPGGAAFKALGGAGKVIRGAAAIKNLSNAKNIGQEAEAADEAHFGSEEAINNLQKFFKDKYGTKTPNLEGKINEGMTKASELESQNPYDVPLHEQSPTDLGNRLPGSTGSNLVPKAEAQAGENSKLISELLGRGEQNDVKFQDFLNEKISSHKRAIGHGYEEVKNAFKNKNIEIPKSNDIKNLQNDLLELIKNNKMGTKEYKNLSSQILDILDNPSKTISASKLLEQFRTLDKLSKQSYAKSRESNISLTEAQRTQFGDEGKSYRNQADKLASLIESKVDKEFKNKLAPLNEQWRQFSSIEETPIGRQLSSSQGMSSSNILESMRGSDEGQQILRALTEFYPEASRTALGHLYAKNPESLLNASSYEKPFIQKVDKLPEYIEKLRSSKQNIQTAKSKELQLKEEAKRVESAYNEDVKHEQNIKKARDIADKLKEHEKDLKQQKELLRNRDLTYKQKLEANAKLDSINKNIDRLKKAGKNIGFTVIGASLTGATKKLFDLFR